MTSTYLSIITLNVNRLNSPIKRHTVTECIKTQDSSICSPEETQFIRTRHNESEVTEKDFSCKWKPRESGGCYTYIRQNIL